MQMRMEPKFIFRRRVAFLLAVVGVGLALAGLMWLMNHINWVGDHYCFKTMIECYFPEGGK